VAVARLREEHPSAVLRPTLAATFPAQVIEPLDLDAPRMSDCDDDGQMRVPAKCSECGGSELVLSEGKVEQPEKADDEYRARVPVGKRQGQEGTPLVALCISAMGIAVLAAALKFSMRSSTQRLVA
jgi:hypothetical protein